jgi:PA domain/Secretion system C-terminal sorting domain
MKKHLLIILSIFITCTSGFSQKTQKKSLTRGNKTSKTLVINQKPTKETMALRKLHADFLKNSPVNKTLSMSKAQRFDYGLQPNKYNEQEFNNTMNPSTGRPMIENLEVIRRQIANERANSRVPGDAPGNNWIERGPANVGGRTKAMIFDPTDATGNTVIAGGVSGGLWKTTNITDDNVQWTRMPLAENLSVINITVDPNNSSTWYVGTGESYTSGQASGNGIWKTTNAGVSWTQVFGGGVIATTLEVANNLLINSPASVAGSYSATVTTAFGPTLNAAITRDIVLVDDGGGTESTLGVLTPFVNAAAISGKIALIRRGSPASAPGTGTFILKITNAISAGAVAVIIMNNVDGAFGIGGTDDLGAITIPSIAITKSDGDLLEAAVLAGTVNGTIRPTVTGEFNGNSVSGIQFINDIAIKTVAGNSEIYAAVGDGFFGGTNKATYFNSRGYGLYKSINGGTTWTRLNLPLSTEGNETCPNDIEIAADGKIWVSSTDSSTFRNGGGRIFSSTDNGSTFVLKHTVVGNGGGQRVEIEASNTTADKIYVLAELAQATATATIEVQILRTLNGFATPPTDLTLPPDTDGRSATYGFTGAQSSYNLFIESDPTNDANLYVGGLNLHKSTNSGNSWVQISDWVQIGGQPAVNLVHSDQHSMVFKPGTPNTAIFGCDGGVYYCASLSAANDTNAVIRSRNNGFVTTQFVGVAVMPQGVAGTTGDFFVAGAQDNGTQYFPSSLSTATGAATGILNSTRTQGGDGGIPLFDQGSDKYYVSNYVYNDNLNTRGLNGNLIKNLNFNNDPNLSRGQFYPAMVLNSVNDIVYSDFSGGTPFTSTIRRFTNIKTLGVLTTVDLTNPLMTGYPLALQVGKVTPTTLYAGTTSGKLLRITNAHNSAGTWVDITGANFVGSISDIEFGANDSQIFVTIKNYGVNSIWYTANGGTNWYSIEGNLPDLPVNAILQNPLKADEVMIGTELGVWFANGFNPTATAAQPLVWRQAYNGMSNVKVTDLDLQPNAPAPTVPSAYNVFAATYGRGVFSGPLTATTLSITDNSLVSNAIKVYPTISNGNVTISATKYFGDTKLDLFDISGKKVFSTSITLDNTELKINLGNLSSGNYFLKLNGVDFTDTKKLIIE